MNILDINGQISKFRKSTLCWLLNDKIRFTNDRLQRYVCGNNVSILQQKELDQNEKIEYKTFISKGDFIVVFIDFQFYLVLVLNFQIMNRKTLSKSRFKKNDCNLEEKKSAEIGVIGDFYKITAESNLIPENRNEYLSVQHYIFHVNKEFIDLNSFEISPMVWDHCNNQVEFINQ
jgi:hypothetical protein